ncbi:MAG: TRIC cation channel family protein, partial [Betaproteobacteria bacterium]
IGVMVALETRVQPLWLWGPILAALTGAGGAILRDVIRSDANNPGLKESFYAEVSLIWGLIFALFLEWYSMQSRYEPMHLSAAVAVVVLGALATRIAVVYFRFKSPIY